MILQAEGLRLSLAAAKEKLTQTDNTVQRRAAAVALGMLAFPRVAARTVTAPRSRADRGDEQQHASPPGPRSRMVGSVDHADRGQQIGLSFDLGVLAIDGWSDVTEVTAMVDRCQSSVHVEGELDERIVGFYERLRARFPDYPPYSDSDDCPWMSMPLDVGIDHVFMCLSFSEHSEAFRVTA